MDNCIIKSTVDKATLAIYGVKFGVLYKAGKDEHKKDGSVVVHLTAPDGKKIEIPSDLVVFLTTYYPPPPPI
jgi:beta-lactamase superfamily II metal-dependent hydrolase